MDTLFAIIGLFLLRGVTSYINEYAAQLCGSSFTFALMTIDKLL